MKLTLVFFALFLAGAGAISAPQNQSDRQSEVRPKRNRSLDGTPLDPFKEGERVRAKEQARKNYEELKDAAAELADLTQKLNQDVLDSGQDVISARIFDRLDKIEKLTKRIKDKARSGS